MSVSRWDTLTSVQPCTKVKARFEREQMGYEEVADMIDSIIRGAGESAKAPDITPLDKLYYIARESYTRGYMVALYLSNEAVKEAIAQLQEA